MDKLLRHPAFFPATTTLAFVFAILTGVLSVGQGEGFGLPWMPLAAKSLLTLAFLMLAAWFLAAFTRVESPDGDEVCQAEQRASMFRFAYMFSLFSFALLVLPFVAMVRTHESPPDAGPIRLLRACVVLPAAARPASGVAGPVDLCPDPIPPGTVSYPWLVAVGGVIAQECGKGGFECSRPPAGQSAAAGAAPPSAAKGTVGNDEKPNDSPPLYSVRGGFVVPFYVVVFSFVGGVVNLTRRVPEYQKRSACTFKGTPTETPVSMLEAREFVIFQLMQLLSSPFVAMVAYYALEPKSIASAVGLAFVSGFSTESVLLLIRGAVNGLRPESTKTSAAAASAQLHVVVKPAGGAAVDSRTRVQLRRLPTATSSIKEAVVDAGGEIEFKDLSPGTVWVVATLSLPGAAPLQTAAPKKVDLVAGQTVSTEVALP